MKVNNLKEPTHTQIRYDNVIRDQRKFKKLKIKNKEIEIEINWLDFEKKK